MTDIEQEKLYASRGYRPANNPDPQAYDQAILDAQPFSGQDFQEFPKWKYHAVQIPVVVKSAAEERALGAEWEDAPIVATEDDLAEVHSEPAARPAGDQMAEYAASREAAAPKVKAKKKTAPAKKAKAQHKAGAPA